MISFSLQSNIAYLRKEILGLKSLRKENIVDALDECNAIIYNRIIDNLTGRVLNRRTGKLIRSIKQTPAREISSGIYQAKIQNKMSPVNYGAALEFGYTVPAMVIRPKTKKALSFRPRGMSGPIRMTGKGRPTKKAGGKFSLNICVRSVNRPAYSVLPKPWFYMAVSESKLDVWAILHKANLSTIEG